MHWLLNLKEFVERYGGFQGHIPLQALIYGHFSTEYLKNIIVQIMGSDNISLKNSCKNAIYERVSKVLWNIH